jgi:hypothetical protein
MTKDECLTINDEVIMNHETGNTRAKSGSSLVIWDVPSSLAIGHSSFRGAVIPHFP